MNPDQHCTYENQDGVDDYSFSHTAAYCGKPQPRLCGCAFCYPDDPTCLGGAEVGVDWVEGLVLHENDVAWHRWNPEVYE